GMLGGHGVPFRLCLRLSAPAEEGGSWRLDYGLQAADDPAVLVPAEAVWAVGGAVARLAGRRVEEPQELLLGELGRAGAVLRATSPLPEGEGQGEGATQRSGEAGRAPFAPWRSIAESLLDPRPTGVDLSADQAYAFLREAVPALEE